MMVLLEMLRDRRLFLFLLMLLSPSTQVAFANDSMVDEAYVPLITENSQEGHDVFLSEDSNVKLISYAYKVIFNQYFLMFVISTTIIGVVFGISDKVVVFRDYNDLGFIFIFALLPYVLMMLYMLNTEQEYHMFLVGLFVIAETAAILYIAAGTIKDNKNLFLAFIAFVSKIPLSIVFILSFINFIAPTGKNFEKRAQKRQNSLILMFFLSPIIFKLVKNKTGFFNPEKTLKQKGMIG